MKEQSTKIVYHRDFYYSEKQNKFLRKVSDGRNRSLDKELEIPEERTTTEIQTFSYKKNSLTNLEMRNPNNINFPTRPQPVKGIKTMRNMGNTTPDYTMSSPGSPNDQLYQSQHGMNSSQAKRKTSADVVSLFLGDRDGHHDC